MNSGKVPTPCPSPHGSQQGYGAPLLGLPPPVPFMLVSIRQWPFPSEAIRAASCRTSASAPLCFLCCEACCAAWEAVSASWATPALPGPRKELVHVAGALLTE